MEILNSLTPFPDIKLLIDEHQNTFNSLISLKYQIEQAADFICKAVNNGGKIYWIGNGGSASLCQHFSAELIGKFYNNRKSIPSIALTTDTSILTAISNDYGYEYVFVRQLEGLCRPGDVVVALTTSGRSQNIIYALTKAKKLGAYCIALTGQDVEIINSCTHLCLSVASADSARIQEAHLFIGHVLCQWIETAMITKGFSDVE